MCNHQRFLVSLYRLFHYGGWIGSREYYSLGLVGKWFAVSHRGRALGIMNSGSGLGMVFSGFIVPIFMIWNEDGWRMSWGVLAVCVVIILVLNLFFLIDNPSKINEKPVGNVVQSVRKRENNASLIENIYRNKSILLIGLTYFAWGFSYLIFSTFFC